MIWKYALCVTLCLMFIGGCAADIQHSESVIETATTLTQTTTVTQTREETTTEAPQTTTETRTESMTEPLVFSIETINEEIAATMTGKSFHENTHIQLEDLRYVKVIHVGYDGNDHQGALVVHEVIAEDVVAIFQDMYEAKYPIESVIPIDAFDGDDNRSMMANNSSAFNYRVVSGTDRLSRHAYGLAVDINPFVNPWVTSSGVFPEEAAKYADRTLEDQGMIKKGDACYKAFVSRGFTWGGEWNSSKDYQHFDIQIEGINK